MKFDSHIAIYTDLHDEDKKEKCQNIPSNLGIFLDGMDLQMRAQKIKI